MQGVVSMVVCASTLMLSASQPVIRPGDTTEGYLSQYGINVTEHFATTDDNYVLRMFRLSRPGAPVVLLQHGILASSWCWLVNSPEKSLGIALWTKGYDVWLTNSRGNTYSRNHTKYYPLFNEKFWEYTFDDMGNSDVIANVEHILGATQKDTLTFVGWSQGTTQMFIAAQGKHKRYLDKHVNLFVALSPVTYMTHQTSIILDIVKVLKLGAIVEKIWPFGFLDLAQEPAIAEWLCQVTNGTLCTLTVDKICGTSELDDAHMIENLVAHFPAGTSVKDLNHYEQFILQEHFGRYDYGTRKNLEHYLWPTPPKYDLGKLGMKTALFMGSKDALADPSDTARMREDLKGNANVVFSKEYTGYSHVTWLVGTSTEWLEDLMHVVSQYNPLAEQWIHV
jgi:pimeloyl-ACP methyl ester carboxylesterase